MGAMTTATALPLPALVTAICAALALAGCGGLDMRGDLTERTETETVDAADVERIEITTDNGRVVVTTGASDAITVTARLQESDTGDADHTLRADGGRLLVAGHCDDGWFDRCSVGFEVTVPEGVAVDVETDNGRIDLAGVAGRVDVETDNGTITGDGLASTAVRARTDNGRIDLVFAAVPAEVTASTDNGAVAIQFPDDGDAHAVSAASDNGAVDVDVRTDPTSDRHVTIETDNGAIDVAYTP